MRVNLLLKIPAGTGFDTLSEAVQAVIASILVGDYTPNNLAGTRNDSGEAIIQAQVDIHTDHFPTLVAVDQMLIDNGLVGWSVYAAVAPYAREVVTPEVAPIVTGTIDNPIITGGSAAVTKPVVLRPVPLEAIRFCNDVFDDDGNAYRPTAPHPLSQNFGDNPWVWATA